MEQVEKSILLKDMWTYYGLEHNANYAERLREAYDYIKGLGITSYEQFLDTKNLKIGAFEYDEFTIFKRIEDREYLKLLSGLTNNFIARVKALDPKSKKNNELTSFGTSDIALKYSKLVADLWTYYGIQRNQNYSDELRDAYDEVKENGITSLEEFLKAKHLKIGRFGYDEITIFDRLEEDEYLKLLSDAISDFSNRVKAYNTKPDYGDELASWGTLGNTPKRAELIKQGYITNGLTDEEQKRHFGL